MLVAFLFQPLAMQMLRADDLIRQQGIAPQAPVTVDLHPGSDAALRGRLVTPPRQWCFCGNPTTHVRI